MTYYCMCVPQWWRGRRELGTIPQWGRPLSINSEIKFMGAPAITKHRQCMYYNFLEKPVSCHVDDAKLC